MKCIQITLPLPISVNGAYSTVKTPNGKTIRVKSQEYRDWEKLANIAMNQSGYTHEIIGDAWLGVDYKYFLPLYTKEGKKKIRDLDNYFKCVNDFLTTRIKGFKDHKIINIYAKKIDSDKNIVEVVIFEK